MQQAIIGYHQDDEGHWVADLRCGHGQHVRHQPPMTSRPWILTEEGRRTFLGTELNCKKCEEGVTGLTLPGPSLEGPGRLIRGMTRLVRTDGETR